MALRYIGTTGDLSDETLIKRAALFFDEIVVPDFAFPAEFLVQHGIVRGDSEAILDRGFKQRDHHVADSTMDAFGAQLRALSDSSEAFVSGLVGQLRDRAQIQAASKHIAEHHHALNDVIARLSAEVVGRVLCDDMVLPIVSDHRLTTPPHISGRAAVARVVLNELPIPAADTPWQAILDWRADADAREHYRQLRAWIGQITRTQPSLLDISEELAAKLAAYERYMRLHHKRFVRGRVHAIVVAITGVLEDVCAFRFSAAVDRLFTVSKDEIALLESEMRAPGREVAYVVQARRHFA